MPANSFNLFANARNISEQLRRRIDAEKASGGESLATMQAALTQIALLWEELNSQSTALTEERQRYDNFFEFAPEPYLITEPLGEIRETNRAARELLGEAEDALEGRLLAERVPEDQRPAFRAKLVSVRGQPEGELSAWAGPLRCAKGTEQVQFRVRSIKVRRKNADGLCWLIRRLES